MSQELKEFPIQVCPYNSWFKFKRCTITSCKNYNVVTPSRCLGIDRVVPSGAKFISDVEIHMYKYKGKGKKITTRLVSMVRKKSVDRVKYILVLRSLIEYIKTHYEDEGETRPLLGGKMAQGLQKKYPLKVKQLGFKNWMLYYIIDDNIFREFLSKQTGGECADYKQEQLLNLTRLRYTKLLTEIGDIT